MTETPQVSVVAALYDDAATTAELVERLCRALEAADKTFEIVLVDDGSTDETAAIARRLAAADARLRVIEMGRNSGQVAALARGVFAARGEVAVTLDGDLQDPPEEISKLLAALERADVGSGCRLRRHESWPRFLMSRAIHWMACWLSGRRLRDFGGNFKGYRRPVIEVLRRRWRPSLPLFTLALANGFTVAEVGVERAPRRAGTSRYTLGAGARVAANIAATFPGAVVRTALVLAALVAVGALALYSPPAPPLLETLEPEGAQENGGHVPVAGRMRRYMKRTIERGYSDVAGDLRRDTPGLDLNELTRAG